MKRSSSSSERTFRFTINNLRLGEFDLGGVLYHANYFHLYEMTREAFLESIKHPYTSLVSEGKHLAVVESHQVFSAPISYGEILELSLSVRELSKAAVTFDYEIAVNDKIQHSAWTKHVHVAKVEGKFKVVPISESLYASLVPYRQSLETETF